MIKSINGEGGTLRGLLASKVTTILTLFAARNKISFMVLGQASASTHMRICSPYYPNHPGKGKLTRLDLGCVISPADYFG
jgi:hypothetical protein